MSYLGKLSSSLKRIRGSQIAQNEPTTYLDKLIDFYTTRSGYQAFTSLMSRPEEWGEESNIRSYLEKYGISEREYEKDWKHLHSSIFHLDRRLPEMLFKKEFEFIVLLGPGTLDPDDFKRLQMCMRELGEAQLLVLNDEFHVIDTEWVKYRLKMKFPAEISWKEISSGHCISAVLFEAPYENSYLFGDSGEWGMYSANEYEVSPTEPRPMRIIGFKPEHGELFRCAFEIADAQYWEDVSKWVEPPKKRGWFRFGAMKRDKLSLPDLREWLPSAYRP